MEKVQTIIADDIESILNYLEKILTDTNEYEIIGKAKDGNELVNLVKLNHPTLVITDEQMPMCSGLEAIEKISNNNIKYVLITAHDDPKLELKAINLGVKKVIKKPILDTNKFLEEIKNVVNDKSLKENLVINKAIQNEKKNKNDNFFKRLLRKDK